MLALVNKHIEEVCHHHLLHFEICETQINQSITH